jgi:DNA-binding beta-propeller fold protein YncE
MKHLLLVAMVAAGLAALGLGLYNVASSPGRADLLNPTPPAPAAETPGDSRDLPLEPPDIGEGSPIRSSEAGNGGVPGGSAEPGAPRVAEPGSLPASIDLAIGSSAPFILNDGRRRTITLKDTRQDFVHNGITVWATATVEVSGPGLSPETAKVPAGYIQAPTVLNGVRVYVATTSEIEAEARGHSRSGPRTARLVLSDAGYTLTDVSQFQWPFPNLLWQEGFDATYSRGLQGDRNAPRRSHSGLSLGMPKHTVVGAWTGGELVRQGENASWSIRIAPPSELGHGVPWLSLHDLEAAAPEFTGVPVSPGQPVGLARGGEGRTYVHIGGDFELGPMLAEWYTAHAGPIARSYVKDWLVAGPFEGLPGTQRLHQDNLGGEAPSRPIPEGPAGPDQQWKLWDNLAPGVVPVAEAVDPYPFSGWAGLNGNHAGSAAYLATYIYSDSPRSAVLNIGSSDMVKVWLDHQVVFSLEACVTDHAGFRGRTIIVDQHQVPVSLQAGWNRLLVKTAQADGCPQAWQLSLRVSDDSGQPIPGLTINPHQERDTPLTFLAPPLSQASPLDLPASLAEVLRNAPAPEQLPPVVGLPTVTPEPDTPETLPEPVPEWPPEDPPVTLAGMAAGYLSIHNTVDFRYFVADPDNHRIQVFHHNAFLENWGHRGRNGGQFINPSGIAIHEEYGWIYIADTGNHRVQKFSASGRYLGHWGTFGIREGQFNGPTGVAFDPETRRIYVVDSGNSRVQVFKEANRDTEIVEFLFQIGVPGEGSGEFRNPTGIAVEPGSNWFYVVDTGNHRIQKFNYGGVYFGQWGGEGDAAGKLRNPTGIAYDAVSRWIYVADTGNHRVQKFNPSGVPFEQWGTLGDGPGQFVTPQGMAASSSSGWVFVGDTETHRVQMFNGTGVHFGQWMTGEYAGRRAPPPDAGSGPAPGSEGGSN